MVLWSAHLFLLLSALRARLGLGTGVPYLVRQGFARCSGQTVRIWCLGLSGEEGNRLVSDSDVILSVSYSSEKAGISVDIIVKSWGCKEVRR